MSQATQGPSAAERAARGFAADEELVMDFPPDDSASSDDDGADADAAPPPPADSRSVRAQRLLERLVAGEETAAPELFDLEFWRDIARAEGLHVCEDAISSGAPSPAAVGSLRKSLDDRGYLQSAPLLDDAEALARLRRASERLKRLGFAAAWLWIFDESWMVAERCWRLLAAVLAPDEPPAEAAAACVLEPSFFAYALSRPGERDDAAPDDEVQRHSVAGGNFGLPHRDHSSAECFDDDGKPTMLSVWCPLSTVTADNGCMFVVPKEADELLHRPEHPLHLLPFDQHARRANFDLAAAVPVGLTDAPGCAVAWHGSLVHWGGRCSRHTEAAPRVSLTATLRRRGARSTALQELQGGKLGELGLDALPLPLRERVRHVAGSLLLYKWWYALGVGCVPERMVPES